MSSLYCKIEDRSQRGFIALNACDVTDVADAKFECFMMVVVAPVDMSKFKGQSTMSLAPHAELFVPRLMEVVR